MRLVWGSLFGLVVVVRGRYVVVYYVLFLVCVVDSVRLDVVRVGVGSGLGCSFGRKGSVYVVGLGVVGLGFVLLF